VHGHHSHRLIVIGPLAHTVDDDSGSFQPGPVRRVTPERIAAILRVVLTSPRRYPLQVPKLNPRPTSEAH
jgi:hypothetical protein